jgi:hypothetical protein
VKPVAKASSLRRNWLAGVLRWVELETTVIPSDITYLSTKEGKLSKQIL